MNKLVYQVGKKEISNFEDARSYSEKTGLPMVSKYIPVVEDSPIDPARYEKIKKHFDEVRKAKRRNERERR